MRIAKSFRYEIPDREKIRSIFWGLLSRELSLEEVNDWAAEYIEFNNPQMYPEIRDSAVWKSLNYLHGCDMKVSKSEYLYSEQDINSWYAEFEEECERSKRLK